MVEIRSREIALREIGAREVRAIQVGTEKLRFLEVNIAQVEESQVLVREIRPMLWMAFARVSLTCLTVKLAAAALPVRANAAARSKMAMGVSRIVTATTRDMRVASVCLPR